jgi:hypothetical protein
MTVVSDVAPAPRIDPAAAWKRDRMFYGIMSAAAVITVFAGFAPTYFLRAFSSTPALSPLLHLHGLIFTLWIVLFATQVSLISLRRTDIHRRLGLLGFVIALLMIVVGSMAAITSAKRGFSPPGGPPPLVFLIIPLGDLVVFASLVGTALHFRRRPEIHRRLMLLTTMALLTPAIARLPFVPANPLAFLGITDLYILVCLIYDRMTRGRIHPAFLYGALFVFVSQPLRLVLGGTSLWLSFAGWLTR